jgi:hypothetical protein
VNFWTVGIINTIRSNECGHESVIHFALTFIIEVIVHFAEIRLFNRETVIRVICIIMLALNLF